LHWEVLVCVYVCYSFVYRSVRIFLVVQWYRTHTRSLARTGIRTCTHTRHANTHTHAHTHTHAQIHTQIHTRTHIRTCTQTKTHTVVTCAVQFLERSTPTLICP